MYLYRISLSTHLPFFSLLSMSVVVITNTDLFVALGGLTAYDIIAFLLWFLISPLSLKNNMERECVSDYGAVFFSIIMGGKCILITVTTYLAMRVRTIPTHYNESQFIAGCVYVTGLTVALFVITRLAVPGAQLTAIFDSVLILVTAIAVGVIYYVPKFIAVFKQSSEKPFYDSVSRLDSLPSPGDSSIARQSKEPQGGSFQGISEIGSSMVAAKESEMDAETKVLVHRFTKAETELKGLMRSLELRVKDVAQTKLRMLEAVETISE